MDNELPLALFVAFAFLAQILLLLDFTARNLRPALEIKYGWIVYATAIPGLVLGVLNLATDQPWYMVTAPLVYCAWGAFGFYVDRYRPVEWRSPPRWSVLVPYVVLFIASQFAFWIPLWYVGRGYWLAYSAFYVLNTGLNLYSHKKRAS